MTQKCTDCGKRRKCYVFVVDPDIKQIPRCKECHEKVKMELLINIFKIHE